MRYLWARRVLDAPVAEMWTALTDPEIWPEWGPTVRSAAVDDGALRTGASGTVTTVLGVTLPFEISDFVDGQRWSWKVAGVPATTHEVEAVDAGRTRVGFGVPWPFAPYLAVCALALRRLNDLATAHVTTIETAETS